MTRNRKDTPPAPSESLDSQSAADTASKVGRGATSPAPAGGIGSGKIVDDKRRIPRGRAPRSSFVGAGSNVARAAEQRVQSDRLDEGLKETFPASDPVAAAHIS